MCSESMLGSTRFRNKFLEKTLISDQLSKASLESAKDMKHMTKVQGPHRILFCRQKHVSSYSTVIVNLEENGKKVSFEREPDTMEQFEKKKPCMVIRLPVKSEKLFTKGTQTDYRESETQTLPWKHEIKAEGRILAELLLLDWFNQGFLSRTFDIFLIAAQILQSKTPPSIITFLSKLLHVTSNNEEKNLPPGAEEVMLTEKARQKLAWENIIEKLRGKESQILRKSLVLKLAISESAFKEEKKEKEKQQRLAISRRQMKEAQETFEKNLRLRLQRLYDCHKREKKCKIHSWNHQMTRKIRKMNSALKQSTIKSDIVAMHQDKTSQLYAPKCRDGENPSLGHEVIDIQCRYLKRFHGLEFLETRISHILEPQFFKSDFETRSSKPAKIKLCLRKFKERALNFEEPKEELKSHSLKVPVPAPTPEPSPRK